MKHWIALLLCVTLSLMLPSALAEESWLCPSCGKESDGNFCPYCNTPRPEDADAAVICAVCGAEYAAGKGYLFCKSCGAPLTEQTPTLAEKKDTLAVGDIVSFGRYEQDGYPLNGMEAIDWQVLAVQGDRALLLSHHVLDGRPMYKFFERNSSWADSELREWLNGYFYQLAFTAEEQKAIRLTELDNTPGAGDSGCGEDTQDKVFLLSWTDAATYFADDEARRCTPTPLGAVRLGLDYDFEYTLGEGMSVSWWLRSGASPYGGYAKIVYDGEIGSSVEESYALVQAVFGVRPAIWVKLNAVE